MSLVRMFASIDRSSAVSHSKRKSKTEPGHKSRVFFSTRECGVEKNEVKVKQKAFSWRALDGKESCRGKCQTKQIAKPFVTHSALSGLDNSGN